MLKDHITKCKDRVDELLDFVHSSMFEPDIAAMYYELDAGVACEARQDWIGALHNYVHLMERLTKDAAQLEEAMQEVNKLIDNCLAKLTAKEDK